MLLTHNADRVRIDRAWLLIAGLTVFRLVFIAFAPVTSQEAYYWLYSRSLDLSYADHPPMIGLSIFVGTFLFGDNAFGIKFMAVVWSFLTNVLLYITARRALVELSPEQRANTAFCALVIYNLTLFAHAFAVIQQPDSALLFFWLAVLYFVQEFQRTQRGTCFLYAGIALGASLLCKYTAVAILPGIFVAMLLTAQQRRALLSVYPYAAVVLAVLIFLPVLYWNANHEWISFTMQFSHRGQEAASGGGLHIRYFLQLLATQLAMLTPLVFVLFVKSCFTLSKRWRDFPGVHLYFLSGAFLIFGFVLISFTSKVKLHWLLPAYSGAILAIAYLYRGTGLWASVWVRRGAVFSLVLIVCCHLLLVIPGFQIFQVNSWSGWHQFTREVTDLQESLGGRDKVFLFADSHKTAAYLTFYSEGHQPAYAQNIIGGFAKQFSVWELPAGLQGKSGLYVSSRAQLMPDERTLMEAHFDQVSEVAKFEYPLISIGDPPVRAIYCFLGTRYHRKPR